MPVTRNLLTSITLVLLTSALLLSGCKKDFVYQRSMSELNQKAQAMMAGGDYKGAIARLESALDLNPGEPNTMHNLAIAYQIDGQYGKALTLFEELLKLEGFPKSEIYKSIGITHEALGDQRMARVDELESDLPEIEGEQSKLPPDIANEKNPARLQADAIGHYQLALENYNLALNAGLEKPAEVENQVSTLTERIQKLQEMPPKQS